MKIKTSELQGTALDWAVAKCERVEFTYEDHPHHEMFDMHYSTNWAKGGPIIMREGVGIWMYPWNEWGEPEIVWYAEDKNGDHVQTAPTPLIAAMRCYVKSKLGDEVEIPDELKEVK